MMMMVMMMMDDDDDDDDDDDISAVQYSTVLSNIWLRRSVEHLTFVNKESLVLKMTKNLCVFIQKRPTELDLYF